MSDPSILARDFFEAVRSLAPKQLWSDAVKICRAQGVRKQGSGAADEVWCRVDDRVHAAASSVKLFLADEDWNCSCHASEDPCVHVAAAAIALWQAAKSGEPLPLAEQSTGHVAYVLRRDAGNVTLARRIQAGDTQRSLPLTSSLISVASARTASFDIQPTKEDLAVDRLLSNVRDERLSPDTWQEVLSLFAKGGCHVQLDGQPITCSGKPRGAEVVVRREGSGVRIFGRQSPLITEVFRNGVCLCDDVLHPVLRFDLSSQQWSLLVSGLKFGPRDLADLVSSTLAPLEEKGLTVIDESGRLGRAVTVPPRVVIESASNGEKLTYWGVIVYGNPEVARVENDRLVGLDTDVVPRRDAVRERELADRFARQFDVGIGVRMAAHGEEAVRLVESLSNDGRWSSCLQGQGFDSFRVVGVLQPQVRILGQESGFSLDLRFQVGSGSGAAEPAKVVDGFQRGESVVPLRDGGWARLPSDWLTRYGPVLNDLLAAADDRGVLPKCATGDLMELGHDLGLAGAAEVEASLNADGQASVELADRVRARLQASLRPYQQDGIAWLCRLKCQGLGALLADDMGLGKTIQAMAMLEDKDCLVICPTSLLFNWAHEISRFRPDLSVNLYHGPGRKLADGDQLVLTSYGLIRSEPETFASKLWDTIVIDESQMIKNPDSQVARAVFGLRGSFLVSLSGTPIENSLHDLWSQFRFANPRLLADRKDFARSYVRPIQDGDENTRERLKRRIAPFILRRLKSEVLADLPPREEHVILCGMDDAQRRVYEAIQIADQKKVVHQLSQGSGVIDALELLLRLRQAACHPSLIPGQAHETSGKLEILISSLQRTVGSGHKALVFSQWTTFLDLIQRALGPELKSSTLRIDGSTADRGAVVHQFQTDPEVKVLLLSLKAGGVGLNLTAADHVFIVDPWWNPAVEDQAADRSHRIGQVNPVMIHKLVTSATVEENIIKLQQRKKLLAASVLEEGALGGNISAAELLELLAPTQ